MFQPSLDHGHTRSIVDLFTITPFGAVVSFDEMRQAVAFDVREKRYIIQAAIRIFNKETGSVMSPVRGIGYVRLTTDQYAAAIAARRNRGRRIFSRTHRIFSKAVDAANDITPDQRAKIGRELAMVGLLSHLSRDTVSAKIKVGEKPQSHSDTVRHMLKAMSE